jgi:hypothetical protein
LRCAALKKEYRLSTHNKPWHDAHFTL